MEQAMKVAMKIRILGGVLLGLVCTGPAFAAGDTHYVVKDNSGAGSPFTDWATAASNIQQAIDDAACVAPDTVLVSNGVYDTGATVRPAGASSNRVVISKAITVRAFSTNWAETVIQAVWNHQRLPMVPAPCAVFIWSAAHP